MGAYSFDLARKGYNVYLIDPVAANIAEAKKIGRNCNDCALKGYIVGDARKIEMADQSADFVLFFGPLYHLDNSDRQIALAEAYRVLKPGGKLFAAAISKFAPIPGSFIKGRMEDPEVEQAIFDSLKKGQFFYRGGTFISHYPEELKNEIEKAGFKNVSAHAIEGFGYFLDSSNWDNETVRQKLLTVIEQTETEPSLLGISSHLMAIGQKPM